MNKVVLITGGARGIGSAIALELAKHGYDIVINYLTSKQPAKELKEKIYDFVSLYDNNIDEASINYEYINRINNEYYE